MKLNSTTLGLLGGAAALSGVAFSADETRKEYSAPRTEKPAAQVEPKTNVPAPITEHELKSLFLICDADKDGNITLREFKKAYPTMEFNVIARMMAAPPKRVPPHTIDPCPHCGQG